MVKLFLSIHSLNVNYRENYKGTALYCSCSRGHIEIVKLLLAVPSMDVNIQSFIFFLNSEKKQLAPLHAVCKNGDVDIFKLLIAVPEINVNIDDEVI